MRQFALAGIVGGIVGGIAFGILMQVMTAPTPDGGRMPMIQMVAIVVRSDSIAVGWLYHLFNSAVIGLVFGLLVADRLRSAPQVVGAGAVYGVAWWVLGALILMPVMLGMPVFASLRMPEMVPVAMGSLVGHLIYGVILGVVYYWLPQRTFARTSQRA